MELPAATGQREAKPSRAKQKRLISLSVSAADCRLTGLVDGGKKRAMQRKYSCTHPHFELGEPYDYIFPTIRSLSARRLRCVLPNYTTGRKRPARQTAAIGTIHCRLLVGKLCLPSLLARHWPIGGVRLRSSHGASGCRSMIRLNYIPTYYLGT